MWGDFWSTFGGVGLALLLSCTLLNVAAAVLLARRSLPRALKRLLDECLAECQGATSKVKEIDAQVSSWKAELEGLIEEAANQFERLERKRSSAAAAASRAERALGGHPGGNGEPPPGATRQERMNWIRQVARGKGLPA